MIRILMGSIVVLAILLAIVSYLYSSSLETVAEQKKDLKNASETITQLEVSIQDMEADRAKLATETRSYVTELNKYERELAKYRGREDVVAAKPTLVAIKINNAFRELQLQLACETGDESACSKN